MSLLQALCAPASARVVVRVFFLRLLKRRGGRFEEAVEGWDRAWRDARPRLEVHEPELWVLPDEAFRIPLHRMPPALLRALSRALPDFRSAAMVGGRALMRRYAHDDEDDAQMIERRLWRALMRELPPELRARAARHRGRR